MIRGKLGKLFVALAFTCAMSIYMLADGGKGGGGSSGGSGHDDAANNPSGGAGNGSKVDDGKKADDHGSRVDDARKNDNGSENEMRGRDGSNSGPGHDAENPNNEAAETRTRMFLDATPAGTAIDAEGHAEVRSRNGITKFQVEVEANTGAGSKFDVFVCSGSPTVCTKQGTITLGLLGEGELELEMATLPTHFTVQVNTSPGGPLVLSTSF